MTTYNQCQQKDKAATRITSAATEGWERGQVLFPSRFCRSVLIREREFRRRFTYVVHIIDHAISCLLVMAVGDFQRKKSVNQWLIEQERLARLQQLAVRGRFELMQCMYTIHPVTSYRSRTGNILA
ncbi:MAG: hypothetical protein AUG51_00030 [Acidobacteria bacterium 13_1_20CM_3_53_8]|nr:MAG: hypothetical protein AUG51_00030 [Acidobacteria bacterium 13_1_20CM_3_53_8]